MTPDAPTVWDPVDGAVRSMEPELRPVIVRLHRRLVLEALGNVGPIRPHAPPSLFPPRRRFLDAKLLSRRHHCETARRLARSVDTLTPDAVRVVHAALSGPEDLTPGRFRTTPVAFQTGNTFSGAPVERLAGFVEAICSQAADNDLPPLESGARLVCHLLTVHPFSDGNGRTARVLFDRLVAPTADHGVTPSVDLWASSRRGYIAALRTSDPRGPVAAHDSGDSTLFVDWVTKQAAHGAELWVRRVEAISQAAERLADEVDRAHIGLALAASIDRNVTLAELDDFDPGATLAVNSLVQGGHLGWDRRGLLEPSERLDALLVG